MFSTVILFGIFLISKQNKKKLQGVLFTGIISIFLLIFLLTDSVFFESVSRIIFKGYSDVFSSRDFLIEKNISRFLSNPFLGTGFNVPYVQGLKDYSFSFDLIVENGSFYSAILGDIGIVGCALFIIAYGVIFKLGFKRGSLILFLMPFIVTAAEAMFFSTNNMAILFYFSFGIYLANSLEDRGVDI